MKAPSFYKNGGKDYEENVKVKQKIHKGNLICTYSYQQYDGSLFEELTKQLKAKGIDKPISSYVLSVKTSENKRVTKETDGFKLEYDPQKIDKETLLKIIDEL